MCSSQAGVGSKPYFSFNCFNGMLSSVHMPSSARSGPAKNMRIAAANRRIPASLLLWFFFTRNLLKVTYYYAGSEKKFNNMEWPLPPGAFDSSAVLMV